MFPKCEEPVINFVFKWVNRADDKENFRLCNNY